jgi:hypothetical protein
VVSNWGRSIQECWRGDKDLRLCPDPNICQAMDLVLATPAACAEVAFGRPCKEIGRCPESEQVLLLRILNSLNQYQNVYNVLKCCLNRRLWCRTINSLRWSLARAHTVVSKPSLASHQGSSERRAACCKAPLNRRLTTSL